MEVDRYSVQLENVSKSFGEKTVLDGITFQIGVGEAFCLLGWSGIGKSVTLKLIMGLIKPDRGRILIGDADIPALDRSRLSEVRRKMGFLFQDAALFDSISVGENVAFPLRRHTRKSEREIQAIVHEKLKEVELEGQENIMPAQLSGGMRKRAGLARALALDPGILLIDEPSSGLDRITASEIDELLRGLKEKRNATLIVVTHDIAGARRFADRFAVLDCGKIAACGTPDELAHTDNPLVKQLASTSEIS
jgi:phospholipid/cholesterol/gamma-HCH transport system ATP-binding protein